MAQPLTLRRERNPKRQENGAEELWALLVEQQGRPNHSLVRQLRDRIRVDLVHDHVTTYALAFEGVFDAIILHRPMEGADGSITVCRELRHSGVTTPILILAQRASVDDIVGAIDVGAEDVMIEPVEVDLLVARLRAFQRRTAFQAIPPTACG
jgi:DNA-binding response OmpR family regulator